MNIGIIGSSGYISSFLIDRLNNHKIIKFDKNGDYDYFLDLENTNDFDSNIFDDLEFIIFTAAISSPDLCEKEYEKCWDINVKGTAYIIEEAINHKCKVLFFSSDAVFGDHKDLIFDEESKTDASTAYGKMKKEIEDIFKSNSLFKAIRLSYVVSNRDKFTNYVLSCLKNNQVCEVYDPFYRNCITISDVLDVVEWLINHWENFNHTFINIASKELIGREDIVKVINEIYDNKLEYKVIKPDESFYKCRPAYTNMKSLYLKEYKILDDLSFFNKIKKELL